MAQMPVATRTNPAPLATSPVQAKGKSRPLRINADGGMAQRQKEARTRKASSSRPRVLVYSPSRTMATMTSRAAASAPNIPNRNLRGVKGFDLIEGKTKFPVSRPRSTLEQRR